MNSPAHDVALFLAAAPQSLGTLGASAGWSIAVGREPATPDTAITVYDTGGGANLSDDADTFDVFFQVRTRAAAGGAAAQYQAAYDKQEAIRDALILPRSDIVMTTSVFAGIFLQSDIGLIGRDENDRHIFTANYRGIRRGL